MRHRVREEAPVKRPAISADAHAALVQPGASLTDDSAQLSSPAQSPPSHKFDAVSMHDNASGAAVSRPSDASELEAERVATEVDRRRQGGALPHVPANVSAAPALAPTASDDAASITRTAVGGGGSSLASTTRSTMEPLFGHDFRDVRVHTDSAAAAAARAVNAQAYTVGRDVIFGAGKYAPGTREGDHLLAHELTHVVQHTSFAGANVTANQPFALARQFEVPPAPVTLNAPAEPEQDALVPDSDKERARATVIAPLRGAAAQLAKGEKADVASVVRHLRPIRAAAGGVKWPEPRLEEVQSALDQVSLIRTVLESLKLGHREAVLRARREWNDARRELAGALKSLRAARPDRAKNPDAEEREGLDRDISAVIALNAQIEATTQDLAKAPRTEEGFGEVAQTAVALVAQFDTIAPPEAVNDVARAKAAFERGIAIIVPLTMSKADVLKEMETELNDVANRLGAIVGDAPPAPDPADDEKENPEPPPKFDPAPSPNPLPPPPPPPPQDKK